MSLYEQIQESKRRFGVKPKLDRTVPSGSLYGEPKDFQNISTQMPKRIEKKDPSPEDFQTLDKYMEKALRRRKAEFGATKEPLKEEVGFKIPPIPQEKERGKADIVTSGIQKVLGGVSKVGDFFKGFFNLRGQKAREEVKELKKEPSYFLPEEDFYTPEEIKAEKVPGFKERPMPIGIKEAELQFQKALEEGTLETSFGGKFKNIQGTMFERSEKQKAIKNFIQKNRTSIEDYKLTLRESQRSANIRKEYTKDLPSDYVEPGILGQFKEGIPNFFNTLAIGTFRNLERLQQDSNINKYSDIETATQKMTDYFRKRQVQHPEWAPPAEWATQSLGEKLTQPKYYARTLAEGGPSILITIGAAILTGYVTKNPKASYMAAYGTSKFMESGFAFEEAISNGASYQGADAYASLYSTIAAAVEMVPTGRLISKFQGGAAAKKKLINRVLTEIMKQGVLEGGEEGVQEAIGIALEKMYNEDAEFWTVENFNKIAEATVSGAIVGAVTGGGVEIIQGVGQKGMKELRKELMDDLGERIANLPKGDEKGFVRVPFGAETETQLPKELSGAKPRYGYQDKLFTLDFKSDIDKATYIVAQKKKSKSDSQYMEFLKDVFPNETESQIRDRGTKVRDEIKKMAKEGESGTLVIDSMQKPITEKEDIAEEDIGEEVDADIPSVEPQQLEDIVTPKGKAKQLEDVVTPKGKAKQSKKVITTKSDSRQLEDTVERIAKRSKEKTTEKGKDIIRKGLIASKEQIKEYKGEAITYDQVADEAVKSHILRKTMNREETLKELGKRQRTAEHLVGLRKKIEEGTANKEEYLDFLNTLNVVNSFGADAGRRLNAQKQKAGAKVSSLIDELQSDLMNRGFKVEKIQEAAKDVDWDNIEDVTKFYRKFVKASSMEIMDEFRYINLLSSPRTHIVNFFSNLIQLVALAPATHLASGSIDAFASLLKPGRQRTRYISETPAYFRGMMSSTKEAAKNALLVMGGKALLERPDIVSRSMLPTGNRFLDKFKYISRALEAGDVLFRTMIESGEVEALSLRQIKKTGNITAQQKVAIDKKAKELGAYYVFRSATDPQNKTGQGRLLSNIDKFTDLVYTMRRTLPSTRWIVPFVLTPMNILKQGIEYSPAGVFTISGADDKIDQVAKSLIGSIIFLYTSWLAGEGKTTWKVPTNPKEKELFYAAGKEPYSVKIGDKWISYTKLGPVAYPMAIASAWHWNSEENPKALDADALEKAGKTILSMSEFFSDQSYVQGIGDIAKAMSGDEYVIERIAKNTISQVTPLSSFNRWAAQVVDPVFRKGEKGFTVESFKQNIEKGLPFLSKRLEAYTDPEGEPSLRSRINLLSPMNIKTEVPKYAEQLKQYQEIRKVGVKESREAKEKREVIDTKLEEVIKAPQGERAEKLIKALKEDIDIGKGVIKGLKAEALDLTIPEKALLGQGVKSGARAESITNELKKIELEKDRKALIIDYLKKGIITADVFSQVLKLMSDE